MSDEIILVCALADAPLTVHGAVFDRSCSRCGRQVQVAPSGQRSLKDIPQLKIICQICYRPEEFRGFNFAGAPGEVFPEFESRRPNTRRNRN